MPTDRPVGRIGKAQGVAKAGGHGGCGTELRASLPPVLPLRGSALRRRNGSARPAGTSPERGDPFLQDHEITSDKGWIPLGETAFCERIARLRRECGRTPSRRESGERLTPRRAVSAPFPLETGHSRLWRATAEVPFLSTSTVVDINSVQGGDAPGSAHEACVNGPILRRTEHHGQAGVRRALVVAVSPLRGARRCPECA